MIRINESIILLFFSLSCFARELANTKSFRGSQSEWSISFLFPSQHLIPSLIKRIFSPISITEFIS